MDSNRLRLETTQNPDGTFNIWGIDNNTNEYFYCEIELSEKQLSRSMDYLSNPRNLEKEFKYDKINFPDNERLFFRNTNQLSLFRESS